MAQLLRLRWLDGPVEQPVGDRAPAEAASHDVVNALTAVVVGAAILDDRWDRLDDEQRRALAATVRNRAEQLRTLMTEARR